MSSNVSRLKEVQNNYENRFNCIICWYPKLRMVYGRCQHRICADCLYDENGFCREDLMKCPTCQKPHSFPFCKPDIPDDSIEAQRCLGVRECPHKDCNETMWEWEMEEHLKDCREPTPPREATPQKKVRRRRLSLPQPSDTKRVTRSSNTQKEEPEGVPVQRRRSARIVLSRVI
ncbi:uncharacterized protein LOC135484345 [Lineus longissimus]|uniref:uncharacterized protein LOC135484345 n=1 Tax=Lineus longissimus TaxID=88925 RepID=UPI002B4CD054